MERRRLVIVSAGSCLCWLLFRKSDSPAMAAIATRLSESRQSSFHHVATFAIGKADPQSRLSAVAQHRTLGYRLGRASLRVKATAAIAGMAPMMHPAATQMASITNMATIMPASCHEAISQGRMNSTPRL